VSFTVYDPDGRPIELGPTVEVLRAFGRFGELEQGDAFAPLHGLAQRDGERLTRRDASAIANDAERFLARHAAALQPFEVALLGGLGRLRS
jgi:hypothetical protein